MLSLYLKRVSSLGNVQLNQALAWKAFKLVLRSVSQSPRSQINGPTVLFLFCCIPGSAYVCLFCLGFFFCCCLFQNRKRYRITALENIISESR